MKINLFVFALLVINLSKVSSVAQTPHRLKAANIFSNNMVLQRDVNIPIWGWGLPQSKVEIQLGSSKTVVLSGNEGKWITYLPAQKAGGPYNIKIYQNKDTITISNVLVGDVWLASGQSNMGWQLDWGVNNKEEEIKNSTNANIRFFTVADDLNNKPQLDVSGGQWVESNPKTSPQFSALAYFFARDLQKELQVPIGIIHSSWGGTKIESWISAEVLKTHPEYADLMASQMRDTTNLENEYEDFNRQNAIRDSIIKISDIGIKQKVFAIGYDDSKWKSIKLPAKLSQAGVKKFYGYCWFRKSIAIPEKDTKEDLILNFGEATSENICYVNGVEVQRLNNQITLRIYARYGVGGFDNKPAMMYAESTNKKFKSTLTGSWKYNETIEPKTPLWIEKYNIPTYIYNAKIAPLLPYALKGIIWYQGETNDKNASLYKDLFPMLINDWRIRFRQSYLPFVYGQLSSYGSKDINPEKSQIAIVRDAQLQALKLPNMAMVVNIDLGTDGDVHFKNKQECGLRFAMAALDIAYRNDQSFVTPTFKSAKVEGTKIRITFSENTLGFKVKENKAIKGFSIKASNGKFVWAKAKIEGNEILVWNDEIKKPSAVRYNWGNNPDGNLLNMNNLPVSPFKTD